MQPTKKKVTVVSPKEKKTRKKVYESLEELERLSEEVTREKQEQEETEEVPVEKMDDEKIYMVPVPMLGIMCKHIDAVVKKYAFMDHAEFIREAVRDYLLMEDESG